MTDLYQHNQNSYPPPPQSRQSNPYPHLVSNPNAYSSPVPAPQPSATHSTTSSGGGSHSHSGDEHDESDSPPKSQETSPTESKPPQKTQSTFLTKLYAYVLAHAAFFFLTRLIARPCSLLEKPENHHMIRWDPAGDHIIVERPEQLALHVLPSVYRQSRFASFSRQLNVGGCSHYLLPHILTIFFPTLPPPPPYCAQIYGFMRKVNLRNVDPAIDDPDASTWCK